jgi:hypothetical protein
MDANAALVFVERRYGIIPTGRAGDLILIMAIDFDHRFHRNRRPLS